jgi:hypothetical protein
LVGEGSGGMKRDEVFGLEKRDDGKIRRYR